MREVKIRRPDAASVAFASVRSKATNTHYLLVKARRGAKDTFTVFVEPELKGACLDILGREDTKDVRQKFSPPKLAKEAWASCHKEE